jgi:hypothetical protein
MDNPPKIPGGYADRTLRIIMIVSFVPALALLTGACIALYGRLVPAIGIIPMAMSLAANISALKNPKSPVRQKPMIDAVVALSLLFIMIIWFVFQN